MLYRSHLARPDDAVFERWKYLTPNFSLRMGTLAAAVVRPQAEKPMGGLCDMRLPLRLTQADCAAIGAVICGALAAVGT